MSYWCGGYRKQPSEMILLMHKIACCFAKQHYGECHLITDEQSIKHFKNCGFTSVNILDKLNDLPLSYNGEPWSWSKIVTYEYLSSQKIHFLHLDYDVFLFKKLPSFIEDAEVFAQSKELNVWDYYGLQTFLKYAKNTYLIEKTKNNVDASNLGIFGGKNFDFINKYSSSCIDMILDKENTRAWNTSHLYENSWCRATIAEQYYLNVSSIFYKVPITYLFKNHLPLEEDCIKYGYTHLWGVKDDPYWQNRIKQIAQKLNL